MAALAVGFSSSEIRMEPRNLSVAGNVDDGACALGGGVGDALALHQAGIAGQHGMTIDLRFHAVTRDFLLRQRRGGHPGRGRPREGSC